VIPCLTLVLCASPLRAAVNSTVPPLDKGFQLLYNLKFNEAQNVFSLYEQQHSGDPMGPVSEAAGHLFSEFERLGILESQFYESNAKFEARKKLTPDSEVREDFDAALTRAENLSSNRLAKDPNDHDALFALTLAAGLRADYAALIEKRNLASLHYTKESTQWSTRLLAVHPDCYDAHIASGISRYIIGSMAAPLRWLLRVGGVSGDKQAGIAELKLTAERGHYLAPFARILLAIAYVRDKNNDGARQLLASLRDQYPGNPLFAREIARLDAKK